MKKLLLCLTAVGLLAVALSGLASAQSPTLKSLTTMFAGSGPGTLGPNWAALATTLNPSVGAIDPASGANDIGTPITITGADFAATATVSLGSTPLTNVTWVNSGTLHATVPWGLSPGVYTLTVVNPDGSGTLSSAFTVTQGIGQWNSGDLFGGDIRQLLMKPGDPNTIYALAYGVIGLFRSTDAGEHWTLVSDKVWSNNNEFAADPLHPDWLYAHAPNGLMRSTDDAATWITLMNSKWPDGRDIRSPQVYVSPYQSLPARPQALFVSSSESYGNPSATGAQGLIKSIDGGATWTIVPSLEGIPVQDVTFDPSDPSHVVAVTSDVKVYQSFDWGDTWSQVTTNLPSGLTSLALGGSITYNPYKPGEVWIVSQAAPAGGIYKSVDATLTSWLDVSTWPGSGYNVTFTSADSVYCWRNHSVDGGLHWQVFGPVTWSADIIFNPLDSQTAYIPDSSVGVRKTIDGGLTWQVKSEGLTGLRCTSLAVSPADPLRVYATFNGPLGIYRSDDGTSHWTFLPITGITNVRQVLGDPTDLQRVYVGADSGFYASPDGGASWPGPGAWNLPPASPSGLFVTMAADPYQAGHLLASFGGGSYGIGPGWLYSSTDYGASWQAATVNPAGVQWIHSIAFDPEAAGTVYLTADGVYKSTDSGATWRRIDDPQNPEMQTAGSIVIATHPQHMLLIQSAPSPYRSLDGGATWQRAQNSPGASSYMFADGDSTRLYGASYQGLWFSSDAGDTWQRASGVLGQIQTTALGYADADGHTILYAATNGGSAAATSSAAARAPRTSRAASSTVVGAGIYRYVHIPVSKTLSSKGAQDGWILESRKRNKGGAANARATTLRLGDNAAKKQYRGILSFGTGAGLPDNAVITGVTLKIKVQGVTGGGNPVTRFRGFMADIKNGSFGTAALRTSDFQAAGRAYGPFKPAPKKRWYSINLTGAKKYVNRMSAHSGLTQVRLRFKLHDNKNSVANYLSLFSGNARAADRPRLIVKYYLP